MLTVSTMSKEMLLKHLEKNRAQLEKIYFQNWDVYTYGIRVYIAINIKTGKFEVTDKNYWNYKNCIPIKKLGTYKIDMAKTKLNILDKSKEKQFQELYVNNDKLYKMAVLAINKHFK
ncbi:hypothetical protein [Schnuerera ultunensis]|uniref:Uncharacterized protein n=1 Tax=[Clostridium] ultunense Esp TaxID=1288971 RepID=A0A1M4PPK3_9FIRM|nr:hypothetical protein [Schnuerera ultunensis]SHD77405.1 protein of unknown function [[Clostridium] ultunense Esp]